ncbi:hypothetical protein [Flavobacterium nitrogenifigens]|uniref:Prenyltransferase n=1 Tax=Flavobacterium nitrogenifigens TaxID=1617283 RepID=A0A521EA77_9FLAO|nr:hypothetical protein [Flavobacterium nitrogenifigens]KAF2325834.1 hypothetical protein DM397_21490 [Flavobacterium nitrogenifigens]SMO80819.1 hypothetical protein SAMN06265220_10434 [Flavobacterium nitrogenifigens]
MIVSKRILDFYLNSSIHVALSCYALVRITFHVFHIQYDEPMALFVFFGTIVGYNFVKYDALVRVKKNPIGIQLKIIAVLSFISLILVGYYFFHLKRITQIVSVGIFAITALYTLPFFPNRKNARNWAGVKIYIVALCWVGATLVLPLINAEIPFTTDFFIKCIQRFILVFVLILVFEILDLANDDPHLQTVPQTIGVKKTKLLGFLLLVPFWFLEVFITTFNYHDAVINLIMVVMLMLFIAFANPNRSKYYTSFWVESVPIFWWLMVVFL